jgi:hypothetical protein
MEVRMMGRDSTMVDRIMAVASMMAVEVVLMTEAEDLAGMMGAAGSCN